MIGDENGRLFMMRLNGAGVESVQAKWEEMFGEKEEEEKLKKPAKKGHEKDWWKKATRKRKHWEKE